MDYLSITNYNFKTIEDYESYNIIEQFNRNYSHKREGDNIIFEANFVACPCIYYVRQDNLFCYSFDVDQVVEFAQQHNIPLTDTYDNLNFISDNIRKHIKSSIIKRYKYNVNYIEKWKKVILHSDGSFEMEENTFIPFQLEIKDNYDLFKKFILKYKKLVDNLIDKKIFVPTITGGLDTRALTGLYRDRVDEIPFYYLKGVKNDGKNNVIKGLKEIEIAEQVCKRLKLKATRIENLKQNDIQYVTLSGQFNENTNSYDNPNDTDWIYKILQHAWGNKDIYRYDYQLLPFLDDDWLLFKQSMDFKELQRILFVLILARDLIHIPFISGASLLKIYPEGLYLLNEFLDTNKQVLDIIEYWGLEKTLNLLKE